MNDGIFASSAAPLLEQVIGFTQARHGVLAGNIANLDTPGYKSRDLSPELFQASLRRAVESPSAATTGGSPADRIEALRAVGESVPGMLRHDGGSVTLEHEIAEITKNHAQHNLAVSLLSQQFRLLRSAISERNI